MCTHMDPYFQDMNLENFFFSAVTKKAKSGRNFSPLVVVPDAPFLFLCALEKKNSIRQHLLPQTNSSIPRNRERKRKKEPFFVREHISQKRGGGGRCSPSAIFPTLLIVREKRRLGEGGRVKKLSRGQMGACLCPPPPPSKSSFSPNALRTVLLQPCSDVPIRMWTVPKNPDKTPIGFLTKHFHRCLQ